MSVANVAELRAELTEFMPTLIETYGDMAATVAGAFYDEIRESWGAPTQFSAPMPEPIDPERVAARARWAAGTDKPESNLALVTDELVKQSGRDTIAQAVEQDPEDVRYARVPTGDETCEWCLLLAGRGAVYTTEFTAGQRGVNEYHGDCDCTPVPIRDEDDYPEGYDPEALEDRYLDARDEAQSSDIKTIVAKMREQNNGF